MRQLGCVDNLFRYIPHHIIYCSNRIGQDKRFIITCQRHKHVWPNKMAMRHPTYADNPTFPTVSYSQLSAHPHVAMLSFLEWISCSISAHPRRHTVHRGHVGSTCHGCVAQRQRHALVASVNQSSTWSGRRQKPWLRKGAARLASPACVAASHVQQKPLHGWDVPGQELLQPPLPAAHADVLIKLHGSPHFAPFEV